MQIEKDIADDLIQDNIAPKSFKKQVKEKKQEYSIPSGEPPKDKMNLQLEMEDLMRI